MTKNDRLLALPAPAPEQGPGPEPGAGPFATHIEVAPMGVILHRVMPGHTISIPIGWHDYDSMVRQVQEKRDELARQIQTATPEQVAALKRQLKA